MFGRRRDIQIPKVPVSGDKATQSWMTAVGSMLSKYIGGGSNDRLVSAGELIDAGLAGTGTGGFLTSPPRNLTKPPKVTGLTANGALASIFVGWHNPSFSNYAYTELWRADIDDIGKAVLIASTAVESYTDNVGSAATKYYWARAVSDQGVKGDFNAASGTKGTTSLDPDYVMQVLTSSTWKPNTTYYPFQYVRPTVENGFQYAAVDGGKSGNIEPTWPLSVDPTVITNDGTVQWKCLHIEDRIPFVLGTLEDGTPAVFMDTAYIKNATITSAKISELFADKIETGDLIADLQVKNKLWYGFNLPNGDFLDPEDNSIVSGKTGFYLGVNGSNALPVLHLNTGIANGSRSLYFDGTQLKLENVDILSSADGTFDDLACDSLTANRAYATELGFKGLFAVSDFVQLDEQGRPIINNIDVKDYFCWIYGCAKTISYTTPIDSIVLVGNGVSRPGIRLQTYANNFIVPYDYPDITTKYRMKKKEISFSILIKIPMFFTFFSYYNPLYLKLLKVYIFDETMGFGSNLITGVTRADLIAGYTGSCLAKLDLSYNSLDNAHFKNAIGENLFEVSVSEEVINATTPPANPLYTGYILINCLTDNEALDYSGSKRLKVGIEYMQGVDEHPKDDGKVYARSIDVSFQLIDNSLELNAINDSALEIP
jgi:hypothetical protein